MKLNTHKIANASMSLSITLSFTLSPYQLNGVFPFSRWDYNFERSNSLSTKNSQYDRRNWRLFWKKDSVRNQYYWQYTSNLLVSKIHDEEFFMNNRINVRRVVFFSSFFVVRKPINLIAKILRSNKFLSNIEDYFSEMQFFTQLEPSCDVPFN